MTYSEWFEAHAAKHAKLMRKLESKSMEEVLDYFEYENLSQCEPDFCPLFAEGKKCHDMEHLNCYLCACPEFRFDDAAPVVKSWCAIDARAGKRFTYAGVSHQDCSDCLLPHTRGYIRKQFDRDWRRIMHRCNAHTSK